MIFNRCYILFNKERLIMKKLVVFLGLIFSVMVFIAGSCEESNAIGSEDDIAIAGTIFHLDTTYTYIDQLIAEGTVENNGSQTITPTWYIEGQFYADSSFVVKLGGANLSFNYPLETGVTTHWRLEFTSDVIDVTEYPNFAVSNLRALYHPTS